MKRIRNCFFTLFVVFSSGIALAQDIEQYRLLFEGSDAPEMQLLALDSLMIRTFKSDPEMFINYSKRYVSIALNNGRIRDAARSAINVQHTLTSYAGDPLSAILLIDDVLTQKSHIKDSVILGGLYLRRGRAYSKINLSHALEDYTKSLRYFTENDTLQRADVYLFRGQAYSNRGQFVSAQEDFDMAYRLYESQGKYQYMIHARQGIISMFSMNGFYEKAKKERDILINKMIELELTSFLPNEYYNQALDYRKRGMKDEEYATLLESLQYLNKQDSNLYADIGIHSLLVSYYCDVQKLDEAKKHLNYLEVKNSDFKGDLPSEMNYLSARIDYLIAIEQYEQAQELANTKLQIAQQLGYEDEIMTTHETLATIFYKSKDFIASIENLKIASTIKDTLYNRSVINSLAYYQTLYEIEKAEKELIEKSTNIQLLEKDNRIARAALSFGGAIAVLGFGLLIVYRNQRELKKRKALQENYTRGLLQSQEEERRRISENLHDGIGQQLLVLKNRLIQLKDPESMNMVDATIDEIRSISRDLHPLQLQEMGITRAIRTTIEQMDRNTPIFVTAEIDNIDSIFPKELELNIYRIIQESLSNILKHSQAKAMRITVKKQNNHVLISIMDNGIGYSVVEKFKYSNSLGLKTLSERTKFLNGNMKISSKDTGTFVEFQIPTPV